MPQNIIFNADNIDVRSIMDQIYHNLKERGYDVEEEQRLQESSVFIPDSEVSVAELNALSEIKYWWKIPDQKGKDFFRSFLYKIIRKLCYFYFKHTFDQQNNFNSASVKAIVETDKRIDSLIEENKLLSRKICELERSIEITEKCAEKKSNEINSRMDNISEEISKCSNDTKISLAEMKKCCEEESEIYKKNSERLTAFYTAVSSQLTRAEADNEIILKKPKKVQTLSEENDFLFNYRLFEMRFRGSEEEIKARQQKYVHIFKSCINVLDFGCGRGEFLELMKENGITAVGADMSGDNVKYCLEKGLCAVNENGINYLESLEDSSLDGIFCAQVVEHMKTDDIQYFIRLAHKKLRSNGKIVIETLNPECLKIFAEGFYVDPSHIRPVHPQTLKFMAECEGFIKNYFEYLSPTEGSRLPQTGTTEEEKSGIDMLNNLIFGCREYALIAEK